VATRTFTVEEAQVMLPVLESLLRRAMDGKKLTEQIDTEFQNLSHRVFLAGGTLLNIAHVARRKAERDKAAQQIKDALSEIDATGVQVKDLEMGLLDFPCIVEDRIILLCWKLGEEKITHWHTVEEGFRGRKPIDENILKQQKKKTN